MRLINGEDAKKMDSAALEQYGLSTLVLMENAGLRSADFVLREIPLKKGETKITVLLGKGNNAGDALVMARHLCNFGYKVQLFSIFPTAEYGEAAAANLKIIEAMGLHVKVLENDRDIFLLKVVAISSHLIVDGIFGSGFQGNMEGLAASVVKTVNGVNRPILALDIPSGVNADNGEISDPVIKATWTLTFALPKMGNILSPGGECCGKLHVIDISFPQSLLAEKEDDAVVIDEAWALKFMKPRQAQSHKGLFGHVLVLGGSRGMEGSVVLAGKGALKTGAGLVTYMMPKSLYHGVVAHNTSALTCPLPEIAEGSLAKEAAEEILKQTGNKVLVMGMGLSRYESSSALVKKILDGYNCPLVLDADALMALGELGERKPSKWPLILTPHPGEMARLLGQNIREIQENRVQSVLECAKKYNAITILKGSKTVIATPQGKLLVNLTGNAGMATGGMGDVLAGVIGALLGQGVDAVAAAGLGVYFHGLAGDRAAEVKGQMGLSADDVAEFLPNVLFDYEKALKEAYPNVL